MDVCKKKTCELAFMLFIIIIIKGLYKLLRSSL